MLRVMYFVYSTLDALVALYGNDRTISLESPVYGYRRSIRANYEGYTDNDSRGWCVTL